MSLVDSLQQVIALQRAVIAQRTEAQRPDLAIPTLTGLVGIISGFGAQWFRSWLDDRKARRMLREQIGDEVSAASLWSTSISRALGLGHEVTEMDLYQIRLRSELYDRNRERLGLLHMNLRRGIEAWYQNLKSAMKLTEDLLSTEKLSGPRSTEATAARTKLEGQVQYVIEGGGELYQGLRKDAKDDVPLIGWILRESRKRKKPH